MLLLVALHQFVVRWVIVESTSMYATLRPGDLVLVERWPLLTGLHRGDVIVFRDPLKDDVPMVRRPLLVKRIAAGPGDVLRIRNGVVHVNGDAGQVQALGTQAYVVRLREARDADRLLAHLGLPPRMVQPMRTVVEVPLNADLAEAVEQLPYVLGVQPMRLATGSPRHIFPYSPRYPWNSDEYGPIHVPRQGDTLRITVDNLPLYDRLLSHYEGHTLGVDRNILLLDGQPLEDYVVQQDYYFVLGDARHHSADSRYWGFVPKDHVTGKAGLLLWGKGTDGPRSGRDWTPL